MSRTWLNTVASIDISEHWGLNNVDMYGFGVSRADSRAFNSKLWSRVTLVDLRTPSFPEPSFAINSSKT